MRKDQVEQFRGFSLALLPHIGAEVVGLDLDDIDDAAAEDLRHAWATHGLLLFRQTSADAATQIRLTALFGPLAEHPISRVRGDGEPGLVQLGGDAKGTALIVDGERLAGFYYLHQDGAFTPALSRGGMLRMAKTPGRGGDTLWVDTQKAYAALPTRLREICDTHSAVYVLRHIPERMYGWGHISLRPAEADAGSASRIAERAEFPPVLHPLRLSHPATKQRVMILHPMGFVRIQGMQPSLSDDVFEELVSFIMKPEFCFRRHWSEGDMILYDNIRMLHAAFGYPYDDERIVHRTDIAATAPTGRLLTPAEFAEVSPDMA